MKLLLAVWVIIVLLLHQDWWLWNNRSLVFGFLPAGLAYHAGYAVLAMITMALLVHFLWPAHLEEADAIAPPPPPHGDTAAGNEARP